MSRLPVPLLVALLMIVTPRASAETVCADGPTLDGIDVAHYQGDIDWAAVRADGVSFAFIRVSHSTHTPDRLFEQNWAGAKQAGVIRGVYQYFRPADDPVAQANYMLERVGSLEPGDLPPVIDVEATDDLAPDQIADSVGRWIARVEEVWGVRPIIYTGKYFWQDNVASTRFADYPLWVAQYRQGCPDLPSQWSDWVIWQTSDSGRFNGIDANTDTDVFNGDRAALLALTVGEPSCGDGICHGPEEATCPEDCPVCEAVPASGGYVDDATPCFERFGPAQYWRYEAGQGFGEGLWWTNGFATDTRSNWARWHVRVADTGRYRLSASVHPEFAQSAMAPWAVRGPGEEDLYSLDLGAASEWVVLGEFQMGAQEAWSVEVSDNSGDAPDAPRRIMADAIRVERLDADPDAGPDGGPDVPDAGADAPLDTGGDNRPDAGGPEGDLGRGPRPFDADGVDRQPDAGADPDRRTRSAECSAAGGAGRSWSWFRRR